jgi:hypothetical protein
MGPAVSENLKWAPVWVGGSLALIAFLFWFTMRWSLFGLLVAAAPVFLWTWIREPVRLRRRSAAVCAVAIVLAGAPVDVLLTKGGGPWVEVKPILWGLPTAETLQRVEPGSVVWGGCVMPVNPARYAVLVHW